VISLDPKTICRSLLSEPIPEVPMAIPSGDEKTDQAVFNETFIKANKALRQGNTAGLKTGIALFISSLPVAGTHQEDIADTIRALYCALNCHERADKKGPWNRDLSGYGMIQWKDDLWSRDDALRAAWPHVKTINDSLIAAGLGWQY
jgi:hypothetical protein